MSTSDQCVVQAMPPADSPTAAVLFVGHINRSSDFIGRINSSAFKGHINSSALNGHIHSSALNGYTNALFPTVTSPYSRAPSTTAALSKYPAVLLTSTSTAMLATVKKKKRHCFQRPHQPCGFNGYIVLQPSTVTSTAISSCFHLQSHRVHGPSACNGSQQKAYSDTQGVHRHHLPRPVSYTHLTLPTICSV